MQNVRGVVAKLYGYPRVGRSDGNKEHGLPPWKQFNLLAPSDEIYPLDTNNELEKPIQYKGKVLRN